MLDINVKTIDGQNRSYSVPDNYTVKQFKEKIATSLSIPVERQRLIFQGRELKDANSLQEFDVNGKTLHLVQRVPPSGNQPQPQTTAQSQTTSSSSGANFGQGIGGGMPDVSQLIQHIIGGLGDLGQNATFNATTTGDANGMEVHIDLSNMSQIVNDNEIRSRVRNIRRFLSLAQSRLNRLEEIQSGAPLDDTTNSSIIVGSIHGTASLSDANGSLGTIGFDINHLPNLNMFPGLLNLNQPSNNRIPAQVPTPAQTPIQPPATTTTASNPVTITTTNPTTTSSSSTLDPAQIAASMHAAAAQAASLAAAQAHANALRATSSIHNITDDVTSHAAAVHAAAVQAAAAQAAQLHAATLASMQNQSTAVPAATTTTTTLNDPNTTTSTTTTTNTEPVNTSTTTTTTNNTTNTPTVEAATPPTETEANNQSIGVEVLGEVIQSVMDSYARFLPYLQHYHSMLVNDETEPSESPSSSSSSSSSSGASGASSNLNVINNNNTNIIVLGGGDNRRQRFCNNINDMMHLLGHLFHNLSDLHINIRDRPPRQMHTMNSMQHSASAIISAAVPIEANIQIPFPPSRPPVSTQNNSTTTTTTQISNNIINSNQIPLLHDRINQMYRQQRNRIQSEPSSSAPSQPQSSNESISSDEPTEATDMPMPLPFTLDSNNQETPTPNPIQQPQQQIGAPRGILRGAIRPQARLIPGFIPPPLTRLAGPTGQQIPFQMPTPLHTHLHSAMNSYDQYLPCNSVHFYNTTNPISSMTNNPNLSQFPMSARGRGRVPTQDSQSATSNSQRRRHPAGDQSIASTQPPLPPQQQQQQQQPNMLMPGINEILGMLTNSLNRPASATLTSTTTTTNSTGLNDNQNIRVNIGGIPGQISIATLTPNGELQSNLGGNNLGNIIEQLVQGITGGGGAPAGIANILAGSGGVGGIIPPQQRRVAPGAATVPPGVVPNESGNQMVNALMREAISLMDSNNTNDQRLNQPLREFLRLFGEDEDEESSVPNAAEQNATAARSTLSIFNTLFSSMTLGDMINLARGQDTNQVFERSRLPLRAHIRNYFKNNNSTQQQGNEEQQFELTEENLIFLSDRLYNDIFIDENGLHIDLNQFVALLNDQRVDFAKSFEKLMKHHLKIMLKHVFDSKFDLAENAPPLPPDSTWSAILFKNFNNLVGDLVRLCRFCLRNPDSHFTLVVTQKLREAVISQNISNNSMFFSIFENFIRTQIQQTLAGISMSNSIDQQFIVHITEPTLTATSSSQLNNSDNHDSKSTDSSKSYETVSSTLSSNNFMDIDQQNVIKKSETTQKTNLAPSSSTTAQSNKQTSNWKNILPSEWETIIEQDIQTQQNQSDIRPFSDAYCSGLPAKRRRIISSKNDLLNLNLFKKVLNRTLEKVQLKPNVSQEQLIEESVDQSQLLDSFSVEFDSVINDRLRNDADFNTIIKSQNDKHKNSNNNKEEEKEEERFLHSKKRL